jgi:hypothetical protein
LMSKIFRNIIITNYCSKIINIKAVKKNLVKRS